MPAPTLPQARSELKRLFDESYAIVARNGGAITDEMSNEDRAQLEKNKGLILEHEALLERLTADQGDTTFFKNGRDEYGRPAETHHQPEPSDPNAVRQSAYDRSVGSGVIKSSEYETAKKHGLLAVTRPQLSVPIPPGVSLAEATKSAGRSQKALIAGASDTSAGAFVVPDRLAGYTTLTRGELAFIDVLPTLTTTSDLVEWVQQTGRTNSAAPVAEATATTGTSGLKPESAVTFAVQSKPVEQIATWVPITTRALADAPMMRSIIDDELLYMLREELEEQSMIGTGTPPSLLGLNNTPGIQTIAAGANPADSLFIASLAVRFTGGVPATVAVVNAATLQALRLMRENSATGTLGGYLFGPPNMPGPMTVFGLEITVAQACPATTAFVLNATATTLALIEREGGTIETGWINDQFVRNIITLRAELRGLLAVRRPAGICKVTGMP
jgi:HK97 family phage major capsid protein